MLRRILFGAGMAYVARRLFGGRGMGSGESRGGMGSGWGRRGW